MMDPKLTLSKEARDDIDAWAQNYALSVVLSGTNKYLSQAAIVHLYDTAVEGVKGYHNILLGKVEIDGKKILPPPKVALNEHNVSTFQGSILAAYKEIGTTGINKSPFQEMKKEFGKYYSIFNDGIQKFSMELNGVMVRTVDENFEVVNIPWSLSKIPGGSMNHEKLCHQIVSVIDTIIKFSKFNTDAMDAESKFLKEFDLNFPGEIPPVLPSLFKCCVLDHLDFDKKELNLVFEHWPLANVGDGCSVNQKAGEKLTADIGLLTPTTRCSGHAATGTIKRLTTSKTMCVEEMVVFAEGLKPILRHFKLSGKGTESLNNALQLLEMKPLCLMTWCPTRMCNLLDCSKRTVEILFPLCDTLTSCDIKKEEAAYFLSPLCLGILHLMADLEVKFLGSFLRQLDTDAAILIDVFGLSEKMIATLDCLETPLYDEFLSGLHEDGYGNIRYEKVDTSGNKQTITLQYSHRPSRNSANSKVDVIKNECMAVKEKVIDNMKDNIEDQSQSNTIVEYASAFDMARKIDKETRIKHIKQLFEIYGKEYIHNIEHCEGLADYTVTMKYLPKLKCTENEIIGEFNSMWSILNKAWLKYKDSNPKNTRTKRFWNYILEQYSVQYSNIAVLILILFAISPGTGPLERSYSKLAKICYKDRCRLKAENLEVLYLLATQAIKEKDDELFKKARDFLQS